MAAAFDPATADMAYAARLPSLLVAGGTNRVAPGLDRAAQALNLRVAAGTLADAQPAGGGHAIIWCDWTRGMPDGGVDAVADFVGAVPVVIDCDADAIDACWERFGEDDGVTVLMHGDEADMLAALGRAHRATEATLHSPLEDARTSQLDRLQEEVSRIARMLSQLDERGTRLLIRAPDGSREPPSPFIEDLVRSPARGFGGGEAPAPLGQSERAPPAISARDVRRLVRLRRARDQFFQADLFADPAWDMLLDLYAARLERGRVSVSSLCIAAAVPATTALRWIKSLTATGLLERREDPLDGRRIFVALSDDAARAMDAYFAHILDDGAVI